MVQSLQALHRADNVYVCTGSQPPRSASGDVLERTFNQGFEQKARTHQIDAVHELLGRIFVGQQRCLPQHAPGSGETEFFCRDLPCERQDHQQASEATDTQKKWAGQL